MVAGQLELLVHILKKLKKNYLVVISGRGESGAEVRKKIVGVLYPAKHSLYFFFLRDINTLANIYFVIVHSLRHPWSGRASREWRF